MRNANLLRLTDTSGTQICEDLQGKNQLFFTFFRIEKSIFKTKSKSLDRALTHCPIFLIAIR